MILDDARRYVTKKLKNVEFLNTSYPQDYEAVNAEYRRLRNQLDFLTAVVEGLGSYEFGGSVMKNFSKLGNKISSTTSLKVFKTEDIYTNAAMLGDELSNTTHSSSIKATGQRFSETYQSISEYKKRMNGKLKEVIGSLSVLKDESKVIDTLRKKAEDLRYDLEIMIQDEEGSKVEIETLTNKFNSKSLEALRGMKTFMGEVGISGLLKKTAEIHREFCIDSGKALSNFSE